jgi:hypothetical protein
MLLFRGNVEDVAGSQGQERTLTVESDLASSREHDHKVVDAVEVVGEVPGRGREPQTVPNPSSTGETLSHREWQVGYLSLPPLQKVACQWLVSVGVEGEFGELAALLGQVSEPVLERVVGDAALGIELFVVLLNSERFPTTNPSQF